MAELNPLHILRNLDTLQVLFLCLGPQTREHRVSLRQPLTHRSVEPNGPGRQRPGPNPAQDPVPPLPFCPERPWLLQWASGYLQPPMAPKLSICPWGQCHPRRQRQETSLGECVNASVAKTGLEHECDLCPVFVKERGTSPSPGCPQCGLCVYSPA